MVIPTNYEGFKRTKNARFCPLCDTRVPDNWRGAGRCKNPRCGVMIRLYSEEPWRVDLVDDVVRESARLYHLQVLRGIVRRESPIRIAPTGAILIKCDTPDCHNFVAAEQLKRTRVLLMVEDPENERLIPIWKERDLCPFCFILASAGRQNVSPVGETFERSKSKVPWNRAEDRRPASVVDPATYEMMRRRYKP